MATSCGGSLPIDPEGVLVNEVVAFVEGHSDVTRMAQICAEFDLSEQALQRLVHRRIGLTPTWLIQRRRCRTSRPASGPVGASSSRHWSRTAGLRPFSCRL